MINLLKLVNLHFTIYLDEEIEKLLNSDLFLKPEDLAIYIYRLQNKIINNYKEDKIDDILQALSYIQRMYTQIEIYYSAKIGKNFKIVHGLGTVIGSKVNIGNNVTVFQNVTLGDTGTSNEKPTIEDNVYIYAGAKILGDVVIAKNSMVGANSLVLNSCIESSIVIGTPAKVVNNNGSKYIKKIKDFEIEFFNKNRDKLNIFDFNYFKYIAG